jgi:hypothetical protein
MSCKQFLYNNKRIRTWSKMSSRLREYFQMDYKKTFFKIEIKLPTRILKCARVY